jgi:uncharacterized membrane protein
MPRRGWFILLVSAGLALALVTPAILNFFFPDNYEVATLNRFSTLLMWPVAQVVTNITGSSSPDPAFTIFLTWVLYSVVLWPVLMLLGG